MSISISNKVGRIHLCQIQITYYTKYVPIAVTCHIPLSRMVWRMVWSSRPKVNTIVVQCYNNI